MAKKATSAATIERGRLAGESEVETFDDIRDEQTDRFETPLPETPIGTLAELFDRMGSVTPEDLAAVAKDSYQFREGRASVEVRLGDEESATLRRMLLAMNRSNTRIGEGALAKHVATKADAVRKLMELLGDAIGEGAAA